MPKRLIFFWINPGLSRIVYKFRKNGYTMADSDIYKSKNKIVNIGMVFGSDTAYCFNKEYIHIGNKSVYINYQNRVIFIRHVQNLLEDLHDLPMEKRPVNQRTAVTAGNICGIAPITGNRDFTLTNVFFPTGAESAPGHSILTNNFISTVAENDPGHSVLTNSSTGECRERGA